MAVTVYHKEYNADTRLDQWQKAVYDNAHWHGTQAVTIDSGGLNDADKYTVRIFTADTITAQKGDYIINGICECATPQEAQDPVLITSVTDNRKGSPALRHWRIEGE